NTYDLGPALPNAHYTEITYRFIGNSLSQHVPIFNAMEETGFAVNYASDAVMDFVAFEAAANAITSLDNYTAGVPGLCPNDKCGSGFHWEPDSGTYHTFSYLRTTNGQDGSANFSNCFYLDSATIPNKTFDGLAHPIDGTDCGHYLGF